MTRETPENAAHIGMESPMRIHRITLVLVCAALAACDDQSSAPTAAASDAAAGRNGLILGSGNRTDSIAPQSGEATGTQQSGGVGPASGG